MNCRSRRSTANRLSIYPIVESDVPSIVEQTRRPVMNENAGPRGGWHLMALPSGNANLEGAPAK